MQLMEVLMTINALECYRIKPAFMLSDLQSHWIYVRPGELSEHTNPDQWEFVGRTFHPNRLQTADVERQGYCERKLGVGIDVAKWGKAMYTHPSWGHSSLQATFPPSSTTRTTR
jgi:hypothetical protein